MIWPFRKKPDPKPVDPVRVTVMLKDGTYVAHRAAYRTKGADGSLQLHNRREGGTLVAEYAPGAWVCVTTGKRCIQTGKHG